MNTLLLVLSSMPFILDCGASQGHSGLLPFLSTITINNTIPKQTFNRTKTNTRTPRQIILRIEKATLCKGGLNRIAVSDRLQEAILSREE